MILRKGLSGKGAPNGDFLPEESAIINDDIARMDQEHVPGPQESAIINDDIAWMGQEPPKKAHEEPPLDFGAENGGFLESTVNADALNSEDSKVVVDNHFLLESDTEPTKDPQPGNSPKKANLGGFLSDEEPTQSPTNADESVDFADMKTYMKTENKPSGRFDQEEPINFSIDQLENFDKQKTKTDK